MTRGKRKGHGPTIRRSIQLDSLGELSLEQHTTDRAMQWAHERKIAWGSLDKDQIIAFCDRWSVKVPTAPDLFWVLVHGGRAKLADLWFWQRWHSKVWLSIWHLTLWLDSYTERRKGERAAKKLAR